jgi:hypothetical protein
LWKEKRKKKKEKKRASAFEFAVLLEISGLFSCERQSCDMKHEESVGTFFFSPVLEIVVVPFEEVGSALNKLEAGEVGSLSEGSGGNIDTILR